MPVDIRGRAPLSLSAMEAGFISPLWPFIAQTEALPKVVAALAGLSVLFLWMASAKPLIQPDLIAAIATAVLLIACSLAGVWQYRRNRRSLSRKSSVSSSGQKSPTSSCGL